MCTEGLRGGEPERTVLHVDVVTCEVSPVHIETLDQHIAADSSE